MAGTRWAAAARQRSNLLFVARQVNYTLGFLLESRAEDMYRMKVRRATCTGCTAPRVTYTQAHVCL